MIALVPQWDILGGVTESNNCCFRKMFLFARVVLLVEIILYLVAAEVDYTDAPKNESIAMSLQNTEELYKMKTGPNAYVFIGKMKAKL